MSHLAVRLKETEDDLALAQNAAALLIEKLKQHHVTVAILLKKLAVNGVVRISSLEIENYAPCTLEIYRDHQTMDTVIRIAEAES